MSEYIPRLAEPPHLRPSSDRLEAAIRDAQLVFEDFGESRNDEIFLRGDVLIAGLQKRGHTLAAATWTIYELVQEAKLGCQVYPVSLPIVIGPVTGEIANFDKLARPLPEDFVFADYRQLKFTVRGELGVPNSDTPDAKILPKPKQKKKGTVNDRMAGHMMNNPESIGWTAREWATFLGCYHSTVVGTSSWKKVENTRLASVAERALNRRRQPKASDLDRD